MFSQDTWCKRATDAAKYIHKLTDKISHAKYDIDKLNEKLSESRELNAKYADMLSNYISTINKLKQQTPILQLTSEDLRIIGVDQICTSKKETELSNQTDQLKNQIDQLNKTRIGEMYQTEELVRKLKDQQRQTSEANERIKLLERDLSKKSDTRQNTEDLNWKIERLESELRRKTEHSNNIETELKHAKERTEELDRKSFQQSLDLDSARYRASEENRMRTDAENLLISHSIYR
jgi:chromosome segregation ATPase